MLVQDPATAAYDGMPRSAIATGIADAVLQPAEMARQLQRLCAQCDFSLHGSPAANRVAGRTGRLFVLLRSQTGHDFSLYKEATITRRIQRRMTINGIDKSRTSYACCRNPGRGGCAMEEFLIP